MNIKTQSGVGNQSVQMIAIRCAECGQSIGFCFLEPDVDAIALTITWPAAYCFLCMHSINDLSERLDLQHLPNKDVLYELNPLREDGRHLDTEYRSQFLSSLDSKLPKPKTDVPLSEITLDNDGDL